MRPAPSRSSTAALNSRTTGGFAPRALFGAPVLLELFGCRGTGRLAARGVALGMSVPPVKVLASARAVHTAPGTLMRSLHHLFHDASSRWSDGDRRASPAQPPAGGPAQPHQGPSGSRGHAVWWPSVERKGPRRVGAAGKAAPMHARGCPLCPVRPCRASGSARPMSTTYASAAVPRPGSSPGEHRPTYMSWEMAVRLTTGPPGCWGKKIALPSSARSFWWPTQGWAPTRPRSEVLRKTAPLCLLSTRLA
jgi:hypothetical protein